MTRFDSVIVEADGGSRGNPGPAGYGALLRDADTGTVIAQAGAGIGTATNNVAEYRGLIAGLELYAEHADGAFLEVRMDSKLVIEQMAGRWKVKHPDMKPLALQANRLVPFGVEWTWIPRAQNAAADRLANLAMDAAARGEAFDATADHADQVIESGEEAAPTSDAPTAPSQASPSASPNLIVGWSDPGDETEVVLLRHGVTHHTLAKLFSGPGGPEDPGLVDEGWEQARRAARLLADEGGFDAIVASPLQRTRDTASAVAEELGLAIDIDDDFRECAFGEWDGLGYAEVRDRWPDEFAAWTASMAQAPPGGESIVTVQGRVERAVDRLLERHAGGKVLVVSHVTPIKLVIRRAMGVDLTAIGRMQLRPASISRASFYDSGLSTMRQFSAQP